MDLKVFRAQMRDRIAGLSRREQLLAILVSCVVVYALCDVLILTPQATRKNTWSANQQQLQSQLNTLEQEIASVSQQPPISPEVLALKKAELHQLKRQVDTLDAISANTASVTPRIGELVKGVLQSQRRNVALDSLKTLPVKIIQTTLQPSSARTQGRSVSTSATATPQTSLYRHGVELELRGRYLDLLAYLQALEGSSKAVFWSDARLAKTNTAELTLKVTIFMLSDQPNPKLS